MTILETFIQLRDDLKIWVTNNLNKKANISYVDEKFAAVPETVETAVANLENLAYINEEDTATSTNTINADTLGGYLPSMFAKQEAFDKVLDGIKPKAGFIYPLAGSVVPEGFLLCDGAECSRTEYKELFTAIGTIYGVGDGSTTFNVPNLQTRVPVGAGSGYALGSIGGEEKHTLTVDEMPSHAHTRGTMNITGEWTISGDANNAGLDAPNSGTGAIIGKNGTTSGSNAAAANWTGTTGFKFDASKSWTGSTSYEGNSQPHNNMQPYTVVNYIIATGKGNAVSVSDVVQGVQALPLGVEYGGTGATNAQTARENLGITPDNIGAVSMDLLWENASISSDFAGQTVSLDLSKYTHVIIDGTDFGSIIMLVNGTVYATALYGQTYYRTRFIKTTETGVIFDSGYVSYTNGTAQSRDNSNCKPYKIYGIKGAK